MYPSPDRRTPSGSSGAPRPWGISRRCAGTDAGSSGSTWAATCGRGCGTWSAPWPRRRRAVVGEGGPDGAILAIFGGGGDLAWRKLVPALYDLYLDHWLPKRFALVGLGRQRLSDEEFRTRL
ncbi:MAG: hypothetical protein E6H04_10440, partial [Bacillati bacterium ANGP1]